MTNRKLPSIAALAATLSLLPLTACDLDVGDLNNPGIDELEENPTRVTVGAACTGLLIGNRRNRAQANGYVSQLGILGREAYNFDGADPRYIGELLEGELQPGSPFGGNFWTLPYANVRLANIIQRVAGNVSDYSAGEVAAILGFSKTVEATDLLEVAVTHDSNGGVIDTDRDIEGSLGALVGRDEMLTEVARLLDEGAADLARGAEGFPFGLSDGYAGFSSPSSFTQYNRALRARVAAYQKDYATALTALAASFLYEGTPQAPFAFADLSRGVYHSYSTSSGDATNGLLNRNIHVHPSTFTDAQMNGANKDERVVRKTVKLAEPNSAQGLTSDRRFTLYTVPDARLPIIRNEELLLLRAEARFFTANAVGALADLNLVRTTSGSLPLLVAPPNETAFVTALLYERRYSLLFEGHRWIDARRFGRITDLPLDMPDHVRNARYPLPLAECDARPGEARCDLGSLDE